MLVLNYLQQKHIALPKILEISDIENEVKTRVLEQFNKFRLLSLFLVPALLLVRYLYISSCLFIGGILDSKYKPMRFKECYSVTIRADILSITYSVILFLLTFWLGSEPASNVINHFSLMFLLDLNRLDQWLMIPVAALNVFEIFFWLLLSGLVMMISDRSFGNSLRFTLVTYGAGYLAYIIVIMGIMLYLF